MRGFKARCERFMEGWGYSAIGLAVLIGVPAFLYYEYFTRVDIDEVVLVEGVVASSRVVEDSDSEGGRVVYFELHLEGHAVPIRFHGLVFDPERPESLLKATDKTVPIGSRAAVHVEQGDESYLEKAQAYAPQRWIEGYSLTADGRLLLPLEDAVEAWREDRTGFLYLANAFVLAYIGIIAFVFIYAGEAALAGGAASRAPPVDREKAKAASTFYYLFIPGLLLLNLPALGLAGVGSWRFDAGYWTLFAAFAAALQALLYLHHRRYLSIFDSTPRDKDEEPGGFFSYLLLVVMLCFMLTPVAQCAYLLSGMGTPQP